MEFNQAILANWILSGYRFIEYRPTFEYGIVSPLKVNGNTGNESYILEIGDPQTCEMADGIDEYKILTYVLS